MKKPLQWMPCREYLVNRYSRGDINDILLLQALAAPAEVLQPRWWYVSSFWLSEYLANHSLQGMSLHSHNAVFMWTCCTFAEHTHLYVRMQVLQNTGLLGPNDVVFPTFFTNVTCMRIKTSIVTTSKSLLRASTGIFELRQEAGRLQCASNQAACSRPNLPQTPFISMGRVCSMMHQQEALRSRSQGSDSAQRQPCTQARLRSCVSKDKGS